MSYQNILNSLEKQARSVSFGSEQAERPHTLQRELRDLRADVERAFVALEQGSSIPLITTHTLAVAHGDNSTDGDGTLKGANLLAGRSLATLTIGDLKFTGYKGASSNNITVTVAAPGGALAVSISGNDITISPAAANSTYTDIKNELEADSDIMDLLFVTDDASGNSTSGAVAKQNLSGGTGNGITLEVYDASNTKKDITSTITAISDTAIAVPDNTEVGSVNAADVIGFVLTSHTARSQVIHVVAG